MWKADNEPSVIPIKTEPRPTLLAALMMVYYIYVENNLRRHTHTYIPHLGTHPFFSEDVPSGNHDGHKP